MNDLRKIVAAIDGFFLGSSEQESKTPFCRMIPTGIPYLDSCIVGIPSWTEIYGGESSGKSTLALHIASQASLRGIPVIYLDSEESLVLPANLERAKHLGVNMNEILLTGASTLEDGFESIRKIIDEIKEPAPLIIWDTLSVCPTKKETDEEDGKGMAERARLIRKYVRKLIYPPTNANFVIINHSIASLNPYGEKEVSSGGSGVKFQAQLRLFIKSTKKWEDETGKDVEIFIKKSKFCKPLQKILLPLQFDRGYLPNHSIIYALSSMDNIAYNRGVYTIKIEDKEISFKWDKLDKELEEKIIEKEKIIEMMYKKYAPAWYWGVLEDIKKSKCFKIKICSDCTKKEKGCVKIKKEKIGIL